MIKKTTIWLREETKKEIEGLKVHHRETYDDILQRLIHGGNSQC